MTKLKYLTIVIGVLGSLVLIQRAVRADAPPPPPFVIYYNYEGQKLTDEKFYSVLLTCQKKTDDSSLPGGWRSNSFDEYVKSTDDGVYDKLVVYEDDPAAGCMWRSYYLPDPKYCYNGACRWDYILGNYKVAVYVPSLDKTFVTNSINRPYKGYYGRDTVTFYRVDLSRDGGAKLSETTEQEGYGVQGNFTEEDKATTPSDTGFSGFGSMMAASFLITLVVELIVVLIFSLVKKAPKKTLLGIVVGNVVSVPFLWIAVARFYWLLFPAEIAVVIFEAWLLKLFSRGKLGWKICLLVSLLMNLASFLFGPIINLW